MFLPRSKSALTRWKLFPTLVVVVLVLAGQALWTVSGGDPRGGRVIVSDTVDGDRIQVGRGWKRTTVRLIGVDTPETVHPDKPVEYFGSEASEFTKRSLKGKWVRLEFESSGQIDAYERLLAYVLLEDGTLFNRELIRQGYARAYTRFSFRYQEDFRLAQGEARETGRGLWQRQQREGRTFAPSRATILGNRRSKVYHVLGPGDAIPVSEENRVRFQTEEEAIQAGFRRARR